MRVYQRFCGKTNSKWPIIAVRWIVFMTMLIINPLSSASEGRSLDAVSERHQQLLSLFDKEWQYEMRADPELATLLGENRYNDRLGDRSASFYLSDVNRRRYFLQQ